MLDYELLELKGKLKKLEDNFLYNFDTISYQESKYYLKDIEDLKKQIIQKSKKKKIKM